MTRHAGPDLHLTVSRLEPFTTYNIRVQACQRGDVLYYFFNNNKFLKIQRFLNIELSRVVQRWATKLVLRPPVKSLCTCSSPSSSRRVWSRWRCVCSDPRCCTRGPVGPCCKGNRSPRLGDKLVSPPQTQRADHILPYIQVTHACETGCCIWKNAHGTECCEMNITWCGRCLSIRIKKNPRAAPMLISLAAARLAVVSCISSSSSCVAFEGQLAGSWLVSQY